MKRVLCAALLVIGTVLPSAAAGPSYEVPSVTAAQEALVRLGYDVGGIDGQWGKKARAAMNDLRAKNGLPPSEDFVGSSLELVHRLSPGATTLPHPGILVTDPVSRRNFLATIENDDPAQNFCQGPAGGDGELIGDILSEEPIKVVTTTSKQELGYIKQSDDWYTPIMHAVMGAHNSCIAGDDSYCQAIVDLASKWANADAMKPGAKRTDRAFEDISWIANIIMRKFIFAYADARQLIPVDAPREAAILDWMKRRIDEYHYLRPSGKPANSPDYTEAGNHSLADMMPAMAFGALVGDRSMMEPAFDNYRVSLKSMRDDGSLPVETRRGANSLHYTNFQLGQLISTHEVAMAQGIDPSGKEAAAGKTIPKAVGFLLDAYEDFDKVAPYAKAEHGSSRPDYTIPWVIPAHLGWLPSYLAQFGKDENIARMATLRFDDDACSPRSLEAGKMQEQACDDGAPTIPKLLSIWEVSDAETLGYSSFCLKAEPADWPMAEGPKTYKKKYVIHVSEKQAIGVGGNTIKSMFVGRAEDHPDVGDFDFVIDGRFDPATDNLSQLILHSTDPAPDSAALKACDMGTILWEGENRVAVRFELTGGNFVSTNAACLSDALDGYLKSFVGLMSNDFGDVAAGAVADGTLEKVRNPQLRTFLAHVAQGDVTVTSK